MVPAWIPKPTPITFTQESRFLCTDFTRGVLSYVAWHRFLPDTRSGFDQTETPLPWFGRKRLQLLFG